MLNVFRVCSQFTFLGAFAGHFNLDSLTSLFFNSIVYLINSINSITEGKDREQKNKFISLSSL